MKIFFLAAIVFSVLKCTTVMPYPLNPHTCEYEGGINISNARILQIDNLTTAVMRKSLFDQRRTVLVAGQHYDFNSFRPILMCVNPELSAQLPQALDKASADVVRRYSLTGAAFAMAPALPLAAVSVLTAVGLSTTIAGIVSYLHQQFFEPERERLDELVQEYNLDLAHLVRGPNEISPVARLKAKKNLEKISRYSPGQAKSL